MADDVAQTLRHLAAHPRPRLPVAAVRLGCRLRPPDHDQEERGPEERERVEGDREWRAEDPDESAGEPGTDHRGACAADLQLALPSWSWSRATTDGR